jgi:hypothetical protein
MLEQMRPRRVRFLSNGRISSKTEGVAMPVMLGMILGVFLTVAGAFTYDTMSGRAANGLPPSAAGGQPPMVNWDVVGHNWHGLQASVRDMGAQIEKGWKKITS